MGLYCRQDSGSAGRLHTRVQHLLLWHASYHDGGAAVGCLAKNQGDGSDIDQEQCQSMASLDCILFRLHHASVPSYVLGCLRGLLANILELS